jgi:hypothetical protein
VRDRTALLRAPVANHRARFRLAAAAVPDRTGGVALIVNGHAGTIRFPVRRDRAAVAGVMDRVDELRLRSVSCWSLEEDRALGTLDRGNASFAVSHVVFGRCPTPS